MKTIKFLGIISIALVGASSVNASVTTEAWWRMGESGATTDSGSNGFHLSQVGFPIDSTSVPPSADLPLAPSTKSQSFTPTDAFFTRIVAAQTDNVGMEAWVRANDNESIGNVVHQGSSGSPSSASGFGILQVNDTWSGHIANVAFVGSSPLTVNEWTHLAMVLNGGEFQFYVNGSLNATSSSSFQPYDLLTDTASIGAIRDTSGVTWNSPFLGQIDEVRIFTFAPGEFSVSDLNVIPEPSTLALSTLFLLRAFVIWRRRVVA